MGLMDELLADLRAETAEFDTMIEGLGPDEWELPTPAEGWAIRDQVGHLAWFDDAATVSATDPEAFRVAKPAFLARGGSAVDELAAASRGLSADQLREWFRGARAHALEAFARLDAGARLPWYGPEMSAASFVTARLMETWAHGQDVADALGVTRVPTARLRHVATLGARALPYNFTVRGLEAPSCPVRVELTMPDGSPWEAGPPDAADVVRGPMIDFCLLVVRRRHLDDTSLLVHGETARTWTAIAQAFAGPPGTDPARVRTSSG
ncbi:TIGR03084 family metal-binding protein [Streptosporangium sp. NPDC002721]|uniref:TIGR03084 family metal-binding protein n=1 Tax=Streptosporangium sp. NPDC002721 TaxID=3366188 RepID=UPI0036B7FDF5